MSLFTRAGAPRLRPLEIAASFVSRLAAWLRYSSAARFCFDFELSFEAISAGRADQLQQLAELTGTSLADLSHGPVRQGRRFSIEGELLSTAYLDRIDLWICPECAREDMEAAPGSPPEAAIAVRRDDIVSAIGSCARHRRALVNFGRQDWKHARHDTSMSTVEVATRLDALLAGSQEVEPSQIDDFVRGRFAGAAHGYELLDPMPLNDVLRLCSPFGNWLLTGGEANLRQLNRHELNRFLSTGLRILAGGEEAIVDAVGKASQDAHGLPRHRVMNYIGMVLHGRNDAPTRNICRIVTEAAHRHRVAAGPNLRLLPAAAILRPDRRWCSIQSVIDRHKTGPKAAVAFAKAAGALHEIDGVQQVDALLLEAWLAKDGGLLPTAKVAESIGATGYQMASLVSSGILCPVVPRSGAKKSYDWFRPDHVQGVMSNMSSHAALVDHVPAGMVTLTEMLTRTRGAIGRVHQALLNGTIPALRLAGEKPYAALLVHMDDVLGLMGQDPREESEFMPLAEFGQACGFNPTTASTLAALGLFRSEMRISPESGMLRRMVPKGEVERFATTYVSAARLASELGISRVGITTEMADRGIEAINTGKARITLFERRKLERLLLN